MEKGKEFYLIKRLRKEECRKVKGFGDKKSKEGGKKK
jgi:hypothetical protein